MKNEQFLLSLREMGLRITPLKEALLSILETKAQPLSVVELQSALKKHRLRPNKTSLYRELQTFVEIGIVEEFQHISGVRSFELSKFGEHHHHFMCEACEDIIDFENEEIEELIKKTESSLKRKGMSVSAHALNLYGLCSSCK